MTAHRKLAAAGIAAVAVGAFLPWVSVFGVTKLGVEGDGAITLALAVAGMILLFFVHRRWATVVEWACAVIVTLIAFADMNGFATVGLYVTLFGGLTWIAGMVWGASVARTKASAAQVRAPH